MPEQPTNRYNRAQTIAGLRALADFLDANPDLPIRPEGADYAVFSHRTDETAGRSTIDAIATVLGEPVQDETGEGGEYTVTKTFGAITYHASHIPARLRALYRAYGELADSVEQLLNIHR
jgi:hypothetical protein